MLRACVFYVADDSQSNSPDDDDDDGGSGGGCGGAGGALSSGAGASPRINRFLAREPPDGCEKVRKHFHMRLNVTAKPCRCF